VVISHGTKYQYPDRYRYVSVEILGIGISIDIGIFQPIPCICYKMQLHVKINKNEFFIYKFSNVCTFLKKISKFPYLKKIYLYISKFSKIIFHFLAENFQLQVEA